MINLDYASHTPVDKTVLEAFCKTEEMFLANAMSAHKMGADAWLEMKRVTSGIAQLVGALEDEIIFTSGATEANNLAIKGITKAYEHVGKHILTTPFEHPSVSGTLQTLVGKGYEIEILKVLPDGTVDLDYLENSGVVRKDTVLVCISAVDSELGTIQPIENLAQ